MSDALERCILEIDDRPVGLLIRQHGTYEFQATDPDAQLLNGTSYESPQEALAVVRAHMGVPAFAGLGATPAPNVPKAASTIPRKAAWPSGAECMTA